MSERYLEAKNSEFDNFFNDDFYKFDHEGNELVIEIQGSALRGAIVAAAEMQNMSPADLRLRLGRLKCTYSELRLLNKQIEIKDVVIDTSEWFVDEVSPVFKNHKMGIREIAEAANFLYNDFKTIPEFFQTLKIGIQANTITDMQYQKQGFRIRTYLPLSEKEIFKPDNDVVSILTFMEDLYNQLVDSKRRVRGNGIVFGILKTSKESRSGGTEDNTATFYTLIRTNGNLSNDEAQIVIDNMIRRVDIDFNGLLPDKFKAKQRIGVEFLSSLQNQPAAYVAIDALEKILIPRN
ncbi:MAG: hypothetical protein Q9M91_06660 [Candidatus Dojkabacteria bacterium]|nr:hypothetical protein [Candidatus Dojkabacteria bacterium]MDQ7021477.1 hypothetical protein [Candidatus Dojkabacteria bacterium]